MCAARKNTAELILNHCNVEIKPPVLCVGVDLAWFGGGGKDRASRKETIAWSQKVGEGWSKPEFERIDLNQLVVEDADEITPNADPEGELLVNAIMKVVAAAEISNVVIALDAPLLAKDRGLEVRGKKPKKGQVKRRDCDNAFGVAISSSPPGWRDPKVQPGAPLPLRISAIVRKLAENQFSVFHSNKNQPPRLLIECFPNDALWFSGVQGGCPDIDYKTIAAYKRVGKNKASFPLHMLKEIAALAIEPCVNLLPVETEEWMSAYWSWISKDKTVVKETIGVAGKAFDDSIDSMLSLVAAVSFAENQAHIHQGEPEDGHIIGPGRLKKQVNTDN